MKKKKMLVGLTMAVFLVVAGYAFAGNLVSPGEVSATASRMHTMEDVYDYLKDVDDPPSGIRTGVAKSSTATTLVDADLKTYSDDHFNTWTIDITAGTGNGQSRTVSDFVKATGTVTVSASWTTNPDSTSAYKISPSGFTLPSGSPAGTMHTLNNIFDNLVRFPATGQTTSYTTGDDGDLEKGATLGYRDNGDGTVTDLNTGLMWIKDGNDANGANSGNVCTCADAITHANGCTKAGYSDWRLPNAKELQSIVNYGIYNPSINTNYFPNTKSSGYWSSTTDTTQTDCAWYIHFYIGHVRSSHDGVGSCYVRCVRGGQ